MTVTSHLETGRKSSFTDYVIKAVVGDENPIDRVPKRSNNYYCGGGGGFLRNGCKDARLYRGRLKHEQVMSAHASYAMTPCHNNHARIEELSDRHGASRLTVHLLTIIALYLGIPAIYHLIYPGLELQGVNLSQKRSMQL